MSIVREVTTEELAEIPLACDFTGMDAAQKARYQDVRRRLRAAIEDISELENGYAFHFPVEAELVLALAEFITLERLCCPFFSFALELEAGSGPLRLRLTGREGVKDYLKAELGLALQ